MKTFLAGFGAMFVCIFACVLVFGLTWMTASNAEVKARNAFNAQQKTNESSFDKMWKVIQQQSGVADKERDSFRKTYTEIMASTKGVVGAPQLAGFFTQAKVDVTPDLFKMLMASIESQRESFHRDQQHLLLLKKQHDDIIGTMPYSFFVGGRPPLEAKIVTSDRTNEAFGSGVDNNVSL